MFASGIARSEVYEHDHYEDARRRAGDKMLYVEGSYDAMLDPFREQILIVEELQASVPDVYWTPAASGFSVPQHAAIRLEALWQEHLKRTLPQPFIVGEPYTKRDIYRILDVPRERQRGDWDTGYHFHNSDWFLFPTVGGAGRTGHDYGNHWDGDDLVWFGDVGSHLRQPTMKSLLSGAGRTFIFTRSDSRDPFTYEGLGTVKASVDVSPVKVVWTFGAADQPRPGIASEELGLSTIVEGAVKQVLVNAYERNRAARRVCISHHGTCCAVCGFDFLARYGSIGQGFIHVHHVSLLSERGEYVLDPIRDLIPVCPNCHAMLHQRNPPLTVEELRACLQI